ncbi:hypothetical protein [Chromobacterium haemolyticum]|uniref:hypothetical protein n=1 Tax=Chromobacterium haemolyticum TaxID=394935 RepID=UPI00307E3CAE
MKISIRKHETLLLRFNWPWLTRLALASAFCVLWTSEVWAAELNVTAEFKPSILNPGNNKFINTTPQSGYCVSYPSQCQSSNMFSINFPVGFRFETMQANEPDPRKTAYFKVPASSQGLMVTNESGHSTQIQFRVSGFSMRYVMPVNVTALVPGSTSTIDAHNKLWSGGSWVNTPNGCGYSGVGSYGNAHYLAMWKFPVNHGHCAKRPLHNLHANGMDMDTLSFAYELTTPNPLLLPAGIYSGKVNYSVGPGGDFDFGDKAIIADNILTLNFTLKVEHEFRIDFPPGSDRAALEPVGGWQDWLHNNRPPVALRRELAFNLASSGEFSVHLECLHEAGNQCALRRDGDPGGLPIQVALTMPGVVARDGGAPASRTPLGVGAANKTVFESPAYSQNRASRLHFEMGRDAAAELVKYPGQTFRGDVTVVFDADI